MNYFHVWGSQAEAKLFNPQLGKLDPKTVSCHFIGYPQRSKGYRFYCPDRTTKFVETRHAVFLENDGISGNLEPRKIDSRRSVSMLLHRGSHGLIFQCPRWMWPRLPQ